MGVAVLSVGQMCCSDCSIVCATIAYRHLPQSHCTAGERRPSYLEIRQRLLSDDHESACESPVAAASALASPIPRSDIRGHVSVYIFICLRCERFWCVL